MLATRRDTSAAARSAGSSPATSRRRGPRRRRLSRRVHRGDPGARAGRHRECRRRAARRRSRCRGRAAQRTRRRGLRASGGRAVPPGRRGRGMTPRPHAAGGATGRRAGGGARERARAGGDRTRRRRGAVHLPRALTIAGSDSGAGAGIQADLKTFAACGVYGTSVVAALTAQSTRGVDAVLAVPPSFVRAQLDAVLDDVGADAVKTGMLLDAATVETVAAALAERRLPLVVDPVMSAKGGTTLLRRTAVAALCARLVP